MSVKFAVHVATENIHTAVYIGSPIPLRSTEGEGALKMLRHLLMPKRGAILREVRFEIGVECADLATVERLKTFSGGLPGVAVGHEGTIVIMRQDPRGELQPTLTSLVTILTTLSQT